MLNINQHRKRGRERESTGEFNDEATTLHINKDKRYAKKYEQGIALVNEQAWLIRLPYFLCLFQITIP